MTLFKRLLHASFCTYSTGEHHDYDDIAPDLFQLSEEDVHAFGTNAKLREVLVPFENLQITGELNEGEKRIDQASAGKH